MIELSAQSSANLHSTAVASEDFAENLRRDVVLEVQRSFSLGFVNGSGSAPLSEAGSFGCMHLIKLVTCKRCLHSMLPLKPAKDLRRTHVDPRTPYQELCHTRTTQYKTITTHVQHWTLLTLDPLSPSRTRVDPRHTIGRHRCRWTRKELCGAAWPALRKQHDFFELQRTRAGSAPHPCNTRQKVKSLQNGPARDPRGPTF